MVLPGSLHEDDEGTSTNVEGRVIKLNPSKRPPGNSRLDWDIVCDIPRRLGRGRYFPYQDAREIFEELRVVSKGVDALLAGGGGLAWVSAALSVLLASGAATFYRYPQ